MNVKTQRLENKKNETQFYDLNPDLILEQVELQGFQPTGELIQLNSYENRVFEVKLEDRPSIITKFYRPGRWSRETIFDEHNFIAELEGEGIKVAKPLELELKLINTPLTKKHSQARTTLGAVGPINYAFFPKVQGRLVQELTMPHFKKLGRWLARLHNVGCRHPALNRGNLGPSNDLKWRDLEKLIETVAPEVANRYAQAATEIFEKLDDELVDTPYVRLHGDLHRGNIVEDARGEFVVVDFDDMINGPEIQDFWMLLPSDDSSERSPELEALIESYSELRRFPVEQLELIPLLRGYRIINYAIWIMNRWSDPSFPRLFPEFGSYTYWAEETESLLRCQALFTDAHGH